MNAPQRFKSGQWPGFLKICVRHMQNRRPKTLIGFQGPQAHGEKIWVFAHRRTDQIIYAFKDSLDGFHDMKQLPFNGKKSKPAKLRKDYWSPLAAIQFGTGNGAVGRSVFQKLRELKHLHEVAWDDDFLYKRPDEYTVEDKKQIAKAEKNGNTHRPMRNKQDRGRALNGQKPNSIADIAVVLAGAGRGNKIAQGEGAEGKKELMDVTVQWANDQDRGFAEKWSDNVSHGLLEDFAYSSVEVEEKTPELEVSEKPEATATPQLQA